MTRDSDFSFNSIDINKKASIVDKHDFILGTYTGDWTRNTPPWNKLYRKKLFDNIRFPEGKGYEDAYTIYKILYNAEKIAYQDEVLYCWYQNNESYSTKPNNPKKLCFREEALRLQFLYYENNKYSDVKNAAICFYLNQLYFMLWQLDNVYVRNSDYKAVRKNLVKNLKYYYSKYSCLLKDSDSVQIFEYVHPYLNAIRNKLNKNK